MLGQLQYNITSANDDEVLNWMH